MAGTTQDFALGISDFQFSHLYDLPSLKRLHEAFWEEVEKLQPGLRTRFACLAHGSATPPQESETLIEVATHLGAFLAKLFQVEPQADQIRQTTEALNPAFRFRNEFLKIRVFRRLEEPPVSSAVFLTLDNQVAHLLHRTKSQTTDAELRLAETTLWLLDSYKKLKKEPLTSAEETQANHLCTLVPGENLAVKIETALHWIEEWCVHVYTNPENRFRLQGWVSYIRPNKLEFGNLVPTVQGPLALAEHKVAAHTHARDGFQLTDRRMPTRRLLREIDYCLYCHQREKDSCSKGFVEKEGGYKKNPLGIELKGCPLDERISEMQFLRKQGHSIAALAMIMLDNPLCPGTGHRICNDCMKGCIFQKQDPVNIPENETGILTEVLNLPLGFEIYGLLTRFNPLNQARPYALPPNGNSVLVVGLGPAGYTLCHYLANEGFGVVGVDGLKLEPLDDTLTGKDLPFPKPIRDFQELTQELEERVLRGFGGVSEYGITVRWDKNFLTVLYLTLLRRQNIRFYGGVRFGGTLTLEDAWRIGFQHVALATGAGKPTLVDMKGNLSRGVRQASDFLMALQLTGAFKKYSLANLQVRLPALVVGGGLTALDTATETLAYYPVQVEKILHQFETLAKELGEKAIWNRFDEEEKETLQTFLSHGKALRQERESAQAENRLPLFAPLLQKWGGVNVIYRKKLQDSPAYRLNHEEVSKALEEGIGFIEGMTPLEVRKDRFGSTEALVCESSDGKTVSFPARSISVAAGTQPNTVYEKEHPGHFSLEEKGRFFKKFRAQETAPQKFELFPAKKGEAGAFFLSYQKEGKFVSFYGDNHPDYAGNVVKAMASAKHGAPAVARLFRSSIERAEQGESRPEPYRKIIEHLDATLVPRVVQVRRLTPTIVEVIVKGHYIAQQFQPGQFYRLQNYEKNAKAFRGYQLTMEGLALTGAWVDKEKDLLSLIVLEMGTSSKLCAHLQPEEPVVVMGPTGAPSEIPKNQTVLLVGGGLGNAVLLSISRALRANGCTVLYFAGYRRADDVFLQTEVQAATDQMVWAVDKKPLIATQRPQDISFEGNIVEALVAYASGKLGTPAIPFSAIQHILVIGSDRMMAAVAAARHSVLKPFLDEKHLAVGSINSPMQCMMKEVCAQCLQRQMDPVTKQERFVFSCFNQDQLLDEVDFQNLSDRLRTNSLSEKLTLALTQELG
jgi:NADPH-dependent glutamate synthase beta subunit-like oxidoreductase/NAD(P)H-flavin reductase